MDDRRIIYILEPFDFPSGGVSAIYRHVEILSGNGLPAYVALRDKPKTDFYQTTAPLLVHGGRLQARAGDIFVIPEGFTSYVKALTPSPAKRLMFCQNHYYLPFTTNAGAGIAEFGAHGIIVHSVTLQNFFRDVYGISDTPILPLAIDPTRFAPADFKRRQIAFMPRKLPQDAIFIAATFKRRHPRYADVSWVKIDGATQAQAARIMGESAVFLSLSHRDAPPFPPLEAMASGCLVAGYHGDGGREYMTLENGWWAETGDWKVCVDGLAAAIDLFDRGGPELDARHRAATQTVERYHPRHLESALITFWRRELSTPFP